MRILSCLLLAAVVLPAGAERLSLERIVAAPDLSGPSPRRVQIAPDGSRAGFLRSRPDDQYFFDLWEFDVASGTTRRLVDAAALQPDASLSDQEQARRERARTASLRGIVDYTWSPDGRRLLVPLGGSLWLVDVAQPDRPRRIADGNVLDARISPRGRYVSFVRNQDLYVVDLASGRERRLTHDGGGTVHNGEAEFVAQEEMDQKSGYWWSPDDGAIAFKRYDEAPVAAARRFEMRSTGVDVVEQRYPYAGGANVRVGLAIVSPDSGEIRPVDLGPDADIYLVRADWSEDGRTLAFQRQTRDQKRLDLVAVERDTLRQRILLTETSRTWVAILGKPRFLKSQPAFLWESERDGRRHVYLYGLDGRLRHAVSRGAWGIDDVLAVDEARGRVYVSSNCDAVTDRQVYALPLDGSGAERPQRVTQADGWHDAVFSDNGALFVDTWSDPDTPPQVGLRRADGSLVAWIERNPLDDGHPYARYRDAHLPLEFGTLTAADGQVLHWSLRKPAGAGDGRRFPVLVSVYGGPGAQTVRRKWGELFEHYLAQQGIAVFRLDNRGMARRERRFTDVIHGELGRHEVEDQLAGIDWLARQPWVDPQRIGVFGWSYGGFMALRLLSAGSDRIAAGISGAPVTDWALYDTHYAEQFLGMPQERPDAYRRSGVFAHLDGLRSRLLLIHGMADDNVLFTNTTKLIDELATRGIVFDLLTYPGEKHGVTKRQNRLHMYRTIESFLRERLRLQR